MAASAKQHQHKLAAHGVPMMCPATLHAGSCITEGWVTGMTPAGTAQHVQEHSYARSGQWLQPLG